MDRHLENFQMFNNYIPLKKHSYLEDFIDQEVTSLFIIELEDIGNFSKELKITDFLLGHGKEKASTLEEERFHCHVEEIEVYESSSHEERKSLFKTSKRTNIFSTSYNYKSCQR
jgi:hypothetical protein